MELKLLIFHRKVIVVVRNSQIWKYHYVRGEKSTCIEGWQESHWVEFNDYILRSLGVNSIKSLSVSVLVEPKMISVAKRLSKLFEYNKTSCLLGVINSYINGFYKTKVRLKSIPVTDDGESISLDVANDNNKEDSLQFLDIVNPIDLQKQQDLSSNNTILVVPHIEKKDLRKLKLRAGEKEIEGLVQDVQPTGFHVQADGVRFYIPNNRVMKNLPESKSFEAKEGQSVKVLVDNDAVVHVRVGI